MKTHTLKIRKIYATAILYGQKTFEIRENDRNFKVGDHVKFIVVDDDLKIPNEYEITYVLKDVPNYGLKKGYCVFTIKKIPQ
jgi:hypothetical protein